MNRFNILIGKPVIDAQTPDGLFTGMGVTVRYGYVSPSDSDAAGRRCGIGLPMGTVWDANAISNGRQRGAYRVDVDIPAIEAAVASLRAEWGDIPVQDNSGRCAHLATAPGVLSI